MNKNVKPKLGLIGLILVFSGYLSLGVLTLPGLIVCLIAIFRRGNRVLASAGILLSVPIFIWFLTFTSFNAVPFPLRVLKYYSTGPTFWSKLGKTHIQDAQSQYCLFGGAYSAVYLKSDLPCEINDVIAFAKKHHWDLRDTQELKIGSIHGYLQADKQFINMKYDDFVKDESNDVTFEENNRKYKTYENFRAIALHGSAPFWIAQDCVALAFNTGNVCGFPSYVVISSDRRELAIYWDGAR